MRGWLKKHKASCIIYGILLILPLIELFLSWNVKGFSDWYARNVFSIWQHTYGWFTGLFPFSVGEIMLYLGVAFTAFFIIMTIVRIVLIICRKSTLKQFYNHLLWAFIHFVILVILVQCQNCYVIYHTTGILVGTKYEDYEPKTEDLLDLREDFITRANELALTFERDENGYILYEGDLAGTAIKAIKKIGESYAPLSGYYSRPKPLLTSDFFSQQKMKGYYFPFSLESNYNDMMYIVNKPGTMCHELVHQKGFMYEDEANFFCYFACMASDDPLFQYSGLVKMIRYIEEDYQKELILNPSISQGRVIISELVEKDSVLLTPESWEEVEKDAWFDTEFVSQVSHDFTTTSLNMNGVKDGKVSYGRVVKLLLAYFYTD